MSSPAKMRAAQFFGKGDIRVVDVVVPQPEEDQALVSIEWSGICGSDLHEYIMGPLVVPTEERGPHPLTNETLPITFGHEFCGRILSAPEGSKLSSGQAVMVDPRHYCRQCLNCKAKDTNACCAWGFVGLSGGGGGFSETVAIHHEQLYPIPESVLENAALIEPLTVAWHAVKASQVADLKGLNVLVLGGGPVGIALIYVLRYHGAKMIVVSEPTKTRREQNEKLADVVVNPVAENVGDKCRLLTEGKGVDVVFDTAGVPAGLEAGFDAVRQRGVYVNVAGWEKPFVVPFMQWMLKEVTLRSSLSYTDEDFRETVEIFSKGGFKGVEAMITDRIGLEDISKRGFDELVNNKDEHIKILVTPKQK